MILGSILQTWVKISVHPKISNYFLPAHVNVLPLAQPSVWSSLTSCSHLPTSSQNDSLTGFLASWETWRYQITLPKTQCVAFTKCFNFFVSISKIIIKLIHTQMLPSEGYCEYQGYHLPTTNTQKNNFVITLNASIMLSGQVSHR